MWAILPDEPQNRLRKLRFVLCCGITHHPPVFPPAPLVACCLQKVCVFLAKGFFVKQKLSCQNKNWIEARTLLHLSLRLYAVLLFYIAFSARVQAQNTTQNTRQDPEQNATAIRWAPEAEYGPFVFVDATGPQKIPQGLSVDYLSLVAQYENLPLVALPARPLHENLELAQQKEVEIITSLRPTEERAAYLSFTVPYVEVPAVALIRQADFGKYHREYGAPLMALAGHKIAVGQGYAVEKYAHDLQPEAIWIAVSDDTEGLRMLLAGEVDAVIADIASAGFVLQQQRWMGVVASESIGFRYALSFAYRKDRPDLGIALQRGLEKITEADRLVLWQKWVSPALTLPPPPRDSPVQILVFSSFVGAAIFSFLAWRTSAGKGTQIEARK